MCLIRAAAALKQHKAKGQRSHCDSTPSHRGPTTHTDLCAQLCEPFWVSQHLFSIYVTFADCGSCQIKLDLSTYIQFSWYHR